MQPIANLGVRQLVYVGVEPLQKVVKIGEGNFLGDFEVAIQLCLDNVFPYQLLQNRQFSFVTCFRLVILLQLNLKLR